MPLNESIRMLVDQGAAEMAMVSVPFWIKLFAIFGLLWIFKALTGTTTNLIHIVAYAYGLVKWVSFKLRGKDI